MSCLEVVEKSFGGMDEGQVVKSNRVQEGGGSDAMLTQRPSMFPSLLSMLSTAGNGSNNESLKRPNILDTGCAFLPTHSHPRLPTESQPRRAANIGGRLNCPKQSFRSAWRASIA